MENPSLCPVYSDILSFFLGYGHVRVAGFVGVREAVAAWRSAVAELFQCSGMVGKAVADVVQAQRVDQMGIEHGNDMACGAERTGLDPVLPGKVFDDSVRYPACNLGENGHNMLCRCHGVFYGCVWKPAIKMYMTLIFSTASSSFGTAVNEFGNLQSM